ncbi:MAG: 3-deoxy-D-manno-octulosonic acid kinase [Gammaproteobacteria bacterium]|nr:3-deoxy-D-manno-octulosonic acid kinase [Gammaproteobacteria bacterium]
MTGTSLGPEVKHLTAVGGAMLYDASRAGNFRPEWFEPAFWRTHAAITGEVTGRGRTYFLREGKDELVLRHYRRGGLVALALGDRYWFESEARTRPFAEWQLTYHLHRAGLPVAAPVAARYQREGRWYRGDLLTERLPGALSLSARLATGVLPIASWVAIGRCIRRFHAAGVCHADLNAHNILLDEAGGVYLIDFDRGSLRRPGLWRDANLARLYRSLDKITDALPPARVSEADWHSLLAGYREGG